MLCKKIKYQDFDNNSREETFYFNLMESELLDMQAEAYGSLTARLNAMMEEADPKRILGWMKDIISRSVGKKSEDGRRFHKSAEISEEFMQTEAYSSMIMEFFKDPSQFVRFVNGIIPAKMRSSEEELNKKLTEIAETSEI